MVNVILVSTSISETLKLQSFKIFKLCRCLILCMMVVRFEQRHKTLNYFSVMLSKKVQSKDDDESKSDAIVRE